MNKDIKKQNSNKPVGEIKKLTVTTPGLFEDLFGLKKHFNKSDKNHTKVGANMYKIFNNSSNITESDIFPGIKDNPKYQKLISRFVHSEESESDEFIISEALKIYSQLDSSEYELKIRILELLKDTHF